MSKTAATLTLLIAAGLCVPGTARAAYYDLTHAGTQVTVAGAIFETADFRPAGTGYIDPFVRIQSAATEQGYNTSSRPVAFDEKTDGNFTHDVQLRDLGLRTVDGVSYVQFSLDINETNNANGRYLSLDQVRIYASQTGLKSTADLSQLGTLVYNLDAQADNWIRLDYSLNSGSGQGDMKMLVPLTIFNGLSLESYITLFSQFGGNDASNAGFEEWATVGSRIPSPGAAALTLCGAGLLRRRRSSR